MRDEKKLHYVLVGNFETDGDFSIRMDEMSEKFRKHIKYDDCHSYRVSLETDDVYYMRDFLEELMVSFRVGSGHHYLVPSLYNLVNNVAEALFGDQEGAYETYGGNYEGTELCLRKIENWDALHPVKPLVQTSHGRTISFVCPECGSELNLDASCCVSCGKKIDWNIIHGLMKHECVRGGD